MVYVCTRARAARVAPIRARVCVRARPPPPRASAPHSSSSAPAPIAARTPPSSRSPRPRSHHVVLPLRQLALRVAQPRRRRRRRRRRRQARGAAVPAAAQGRARAASRAAFHGDVGAARAAAAAVVRVAAVPADSEPDAGGPDRLFDRHHAVVRAQAAGQGAAGPAAVRRVAVAGQLCAAVCGVLPLPAQQHARRQHVCAVRLPLVCAGGVLLLEHVHRALGGRGAVGVPVGAGVCAGVQRAVCAVGVRAVDPQLPH
ncbi:hypothetical protein FGB62_81g023 [Gracilaria domingensis]|nr:hypothetical protein FGB62_81g023 [Gracilaria domingensis]